MSPTARTLKHFRNVGLQAEVVERRKGPVTIDLAGCIDIVVFGPGIGILGLQVTSASNHAARRRKAFAEPRLRDWLLGGGKFEIASWGLKGARGTRKTYVLRREAITLGDLG